MNSFIREIRWSDRTNHQTFKVLDKIGTMSNILAQKCHTILCLTEGTGFSNFSSAGNVLNYFTHLCFKGEESSSVWYAN